MKIKGVKKGLKGAISVPGDKSISHRAVMLGALAKGSTKVSNFLSGDDCLNTLKIFSQMGVKIKQKNDKLEIQGVGLSGLIKPNKALDVGNSGTSFRLLTGILAAQNFITKLTGDHSIQKRPMKRVIDPLKQMGGRFSGEVAPLIIFPGKIKGITYNIPVASAQVKSALLLAGLYADNSTTVVEPAQTRDHTERMLKNFGINLKILPGAKKGSQKIIIPAYKGERVLKASKIEVPGDISSAAFFIVAGLIVPGSKLLLKDIGVNPTRTGIIEVLQKMGGKITLKNKRLNSGEPVADIEVIASSLKGVEVSDGTVVRMIDELPIFAAAAALAHGKTIVRNAEELRVKESDRIKSICEMLAGFGFKAKELKDGFEIDGTPELKINKSVKIESYFDHRIAMTAAVLGLLNSKETVISDDKCIDTSFPGFKALLDKIAK